MSIVHLDTLFVLNSQVWSINKLDTVSCSNFDFFFSLFVKKRECASSLGWPGVHFGALEVLKAQEAPGSVGVLTSLWEF